MTDIWQATKSQNAAFDGFLVARRHRRRSGNHASALLDFLTRNRWTKTDLGGNIRLQGPSGDDHTSAGKADSFSGSSGERAYLGGGGAFLDEASQGGRGALRLVPVRPEAAEVSGFVLERAASSVMRGILFLWPPLRDPGRVSAEGAQVEGQG